MGLPSLTPARTAEALPPHALPALSHVAGVDLTAYRASHVEERVSRALELEAVADLDDLTRLLLVDTAARERFRRSLAVPVTRLFRDPAQFELLEHELLPPLLAREGGTLCPRALRAWSAGCANGLELYSLGMLLDRIGGLEHATLLGSDLLEANVAEAGRAAYDEIEIPPRVRARCDFEVRDLTADPPPPGLWDLILCRNVAIYFSREAKQRLHAALAAALTPGAVLLLGRSESIAGPAAFGLEPAGPHAYRRVA